MIADINKKTQFCITKSELEKIAERLGINLPEQTETQNELKIFTQLYRRTDREIGCREGVE